MPLESEQPPIPANLIEEKPLTEISLPRAATLVAQNREADIKNLLPSMVDTNIKLEERQETTRSQLATFLIRILAGTVAASFAAVITLTIMSGFIDERKAATFDKNTTLVKDLITFILTAQTGLIGTALGFYFGSRGSNAD
ncbi:hypothetical protein [Oscillatoria sp. FACHB-1406]|uniref:hypothetical protein n=1 Tax=Oscillatoria sp. FACHB-1406 TaxID=2692846 RepID=UPI001686B7C1|nr:hypothetical protein [Oscillatoria sp. FACHB-1406]MBD2578350.1 hypothetical protein [Oscillatoria sp. FACHB-1406]